MLSAGEASGDLHGSALCRALREMDPATPLVGMGGTRMAEAGVELMADLTRQAVVGGTEALRRLPALYRAYRSLLRRLREDAPRALVLIDFPEFNMRLGGHARRAGIPVIYFIPPQLWAWRRGRVRAIRGFARCVLAVFPFEERLYREAGVPVEFVGHPLLDSLPLDLDREEARGRLGVKPEECLVALLPGSRREEIHRLLPVMLEAVSILGARATSRRFVLGLAPSVDRRPVQSLVEARQASGAPHVAIVEGRSPELMRAADLGLIASGTATLEAALLGTPMLVCYRLSRITAALARPLIRIPWISLPNIVAGRGIVPELLQDQVTGERLAAEGERLLADPGAAAAQRTAFQELRRGLGEPGVARRAARAVLEASRPA
jgi:lipid-A-disaccharide synthase